MRWFSNLLRLPTPPSLYRQFSPVGVSHTIWASIVKPGDIVVDATCGNGYDSEYLASLALPHPTTRLTTTPMTSSITADVDSNGDGKGGGGGEGWLYCMDIQETAVSATRERLLSNGYKDRVSYICGSHESFPTAIAINSVSCISYNLGYLPGSDKTIVSKPSSTVASLRNAVPLIKPGGMLSVIGYRGHAGGLEETAAVEGLLASLDASQWRIMTHCQFQRPLSPVFFSALKMF